MPELPEVETVRRQLAPVIEGRTIVAVHLARADLRRPFPRHFARRLAGRRVERLERRAKYLTAWLDDGAVLLIHLGMSGRLLVDAEETGAEAKHDHVRIDLDDGHRVTFRDPRRFGLMDLVAGKALATDSRLAGLGPEPLSDAFTGAALAAALAGRQMAVKTALMDQTTVAGLGNIYACEALFRARISPLRPAAEVTRRETVALVRAIKAVLEEAIAAGGSTLRDHQLPAGGSGYFQHRFAVYGREGLPCPGCTCAEGIRRIVQGGRSTFFCAKRQR